MTTIQLIPLLLVGAVALVNIVTLAVWYLLYQLVRSADPLIGADTGAIYARFLFGQLMEGGISPRRRMDTLGNPNRDDVIRTVKGCAGYAIASSVASIVKHVPLNFVTMLK